MLAGILDLRRERRVHYYARIYPTNAIHRHLQPYIWTRFPGDTRYRDRLPRKEALKSGGDNPSSVTTPNRYEIHPSGTKRITRRGSKQTCPACFLRIITPTEPCSIARFKVLVFITNHQTQSTPSQCHVSCSRLLYKRCRGLHRVEDVYAADPL